MTQWISFNDAIEFAITEEEAAAEFYAGMAKQMQEPALRQVFDEFAQEELRHKAKLLVIKDTGQLESDKAAVQDLKVADYIADVKPSESMSYEDALVYAMKREKAAFRLYQDLAERARDEKVKSAFAALAQEEAKHKLYFEVEYDNAQTEN